MTILKLPKEGDAATLTITECAVEKGNYGEQVKFVGANGDILYLPRASADRQLMRLGFGDGDGIHYAMAVGNALHFSRSHNAKTPDKPYWNIEVAGAATPTPSKRLAGPNDAKIPGDAPPAPRNPVASRPDVPIMGAVPRDAQPKVSLADLAAVYGWCWSAAKLVQGKDGTPESVQSGAATLMIAADKAGIRTVPMAAQAQAGYESKLPDLNDDDLEAGDLPF